MPKAERDYEHWARIADEWIAWARTPNHDAFWSYRDSFAAFIGRGIGKALDVGCGEGRISRELTKYGYQVTGLDPVKEFVNAASAANSAHDYVVAAATELPFAENAFDLVVAYNVLMDVEDVPAAVKEMGRVLKPGGNLILSIVHPFADHGRFVNEDHDSPLVVKGTYFGRQRFDDVLERDGLTMHFAGWTMPLEGYVAALEAAGLGITSLREPVPNLDDMPPNMKRWTRWPMFLWLQAHALGK